MKRIRSCARLALLGALIVCAQAREARAAAEVHRLNIALSAIPTSVNAKAFNDALDVYNRTTLDPAGVKGLEHIRSAWLYDAEMRYFLRQSIAVSAGVGQLRKQTKREFLPAIQADVQVRAEIISVPVHVGADYYLQAYNQGDFQARAFMGGGFQSLVYSHARLQQVATVGDAFTELILDGKRDSPGYYADVGVHMFFAARFSVLIAGVYRSAMIRQLNQVTTFNGRVISSGPTFDLDTSGIGLRGSLAIGF